LPEIFPAEDEARGMAYIVLGRAQLKLQEEPF
jgi:hypothetical protein